MGQKLYFDNYSFRERMLLAGIRNIVSEYARLYRANIYLLGGIKK